MGCNEPLQTGEVYSCACRAARNTVPFFAFALTAGLCYHSSVYEDQTPVIGFKSLDKKLLILIRKLTE
jgi:hypothetical protein